MIPAPSRHTITAETSTGVWLTIKRATITLDEGWTPYVQANLVCSVPADYATIDPTAGHRISITVTHTDEAGALITEKVWDLVLRTRKVDRVNAEMTVTAESDECLLQDYGQRGTTVITFTTGTVQAFVSARTADAIPTRTITTAGSHTLAVPYPWAPGTTVWEIIEGPIKTAGLRLWSEGGQAFRLDVAPVSVAGTISLSDTENVKLADDDISRDGSNGSGFANCVVIEYKWTDTSVTPNVQRVDYDSAGGTTTPRKTLVVRYTDTKPPASGGAAALLARALTRGRNISVTAISDYTAAPGKTVNITLAGDAPITKVIKAVSWSWSDGDDDATMRIDTRDA
ncbi:hypothetical protein QMG83_14535 [Salinibacterium sp. G-O1]|uniref:hypothetical protein n=1 Tax=Salinibacterium sp. G-O1 TaxID=3046208 RepID=UPI0024B97943|nr:hypothetical protein [Salinibacterium sp. G-O1]MDJ0336441.1 hypothetical protein [Salinibacterium sp. G-O1]